MSHFTVPGPIGARWWPRSSALSDSTAAILLTTLLFLKCDLQMASKGVRTHRCNTSHFSYLRVVEEMLQWVMLWIRFGRTAWIFRCYRERRPWSSGVLGARVFL
ncbi:hypothetical protein FB451DRAFT_108568 [Mycena latifolia]|nr:hypothetical protein FB451DRAFT_108568 [Mycena latifolia]